MNSVLCVPQMVISSGSVRVYSDLTTFQGGWTREGNFNTPAGCCGLIAIPFAT